MVDFFDESPATWRLLFLIGAPCVTVTVSVVLLSRVVQRKETVSQLAFASSEPLKSTGATSEPVEANAAPSSGQTCTSTLALQELSSASVPARLRPQFYFCFQENKFWHSELLTSAPDCVAVLEKIHEYAEIWLERRSRARDALTPNKDIRIVGLAPCVFLENNEKGEPPVFHPETIIGTFAVAAIGHGVHVSSGASILGGTLDLRKGSIWFGEGCVVEPGTHIAGPVIFGKRTVVRAGAYIRGDVITGSDVTLRVETENSVIMDKADLCHPGYVADSLIGYAARVGCQAVTANLDLSGHELSIVLEDSGDTVGSFGSATRYMLGRRKVGIVLGDHSQLGSNTATDPGTFVGPRTQIYPPTRLGAGVYGPDDSVKHQPSEHGVISCESLQPNRIELHQELTVLADEREVRVRFHKGQRLSVKFSSGLQVLEVTPCSPLAQLLHAGDEIMACNNERVSSTEGLRKILAEHVEEELTLIVRTGHGTAQGNLGHHHKKGLLHRSRSRSSSAHSRSRKQLAGAGQVSRGRSKEPPSSIKSISETSPQKSTPREPQT